MAVFSFCPACAKRIVSLYARQRLPASVIQARVPPPAERLESVALPTRPRPFTSSLATRSYEQFSRDFSSKVDNVHWANTFVSEVKAKEEYLLNEEQLEGLQVHYVRSAYSNDTMVRRYYLKPDVEKKALEVWGSWKTLKEEIDRRRLTLALQEETERRRRGLVYIIAQLKKSKKAMGRREIEEKAFGGKEDRTTYIRGSAKVVLYAIASNLAVALMKLIAYVYTGSAVMLSETIHSVVDLLNQCLLAVGIFSSIRKPDPTHPYGFSRARYVYSLISGVGIFFLGAGITMYHGAMALLTPPELHSLPLAFLILGGSFCLEGLTLISAIKQVQRSAADSRVSFRDYVIRGKDPSAVAVLMEDSAAVLGVIIASFSIVLTHLTGNHMYDALGSIAIGGLLGSVALFLIQRNSDALVGRSMHPDRLQEIVDLLEGDRFIHSVHDVKATEMGADTVRFKAEINVDGSEIARLCMGSMPVKDINEFASNEELNHFLLEYGERVVDCLGKEIDRVELKIKNHSPEIRHVDLEII